MFWREDIESTAFCMREQSTENSAEQCNEDGFLEVFQSSYLFNDLSPLETDMDALRQGAASSNHER